MFTQPSIPPDKILTRYIASFGLTALLRPGRAGQPVESLWVGGEGECGIVLFVSALDAEIYRLHARTTGEEWVRHPLGPCFLPMRIHGALDRTRRVKARCIDIDPGMPNK
jgi:hypothetical protein